MGTKKENPNHLQIKEAKTTRPGSVEKEAAKETREIQDRKPKKVQGDKDEGAVSEKPFDARENNIHQKR